jgi:hypothetical protein
MKMTLQNADLVIWDLSRQLVLLGHSPLTTPSPLGASNDARRPMTRAVPGRRD